MANRVGPIVRTATAAALSVAALMIAGCGDGEEGTGPSSTTAAATSTSASQPQQVVPVLTIEGGQPVGGQQTIAADLGASVAFDVVADDADELHIHGYDKTVELPAGTTTHVEFIADIPGVFEIELHHAGTEIAQLRVGG